MPDPSLLAGANFPQQAAKDGPWVLPRPQDILTLDRERPEFVDEVLLILRIHTRPPDVAAYPDSKARHDHTPEIFTSHPIVT
jgi:hypothetical protein